MPSRYFTKEFAKQFNQEYITYPSTEKYQHGNHLFQQFTGNSSARASLAVAVTKKLFNTQLIYKTIIRLENEYIPDIYRLNKVAKSARNEFREYAQQESCTSGYYHELIVMLDSFYKMINQIQKSIRERVSDNLKKIHTGVHKRQKNFEFNGACVNPIVAQTESYLKRLLSYYNHFLVIWKRETNCSRKETALTTLAADYFSILISFTEKVIAGIEKTRARLLTWQTQMNIREEQELYN